MSEGIRICPECNTDNPESATICFNCGYPFFNEIRCPECNRKIQKNNSACPICGFPLEKTDEVSTANLKTNSTIKYLGYGLWVFALVFFVLAYKTRFTGDYSKYTDLIEKYEDNISYYTEEKNECQNEPDRYINGIIDSGYEILVKGWQRLIDETKSNIQECKTQMRKIIIKSVVFLMFGIAFGVGGGVLIKRSQIRGS